MSGGRPARAPSVSAESPPDAPGPSLLDEVADVTGASQPSELRVTLSAGRVLHLAAAADGDRLEVLGGDGRVELRVTLTPEGPLLSFESASLELRAAKQVRVDCESFEVRARDTALLQAGTTHIEATRGRVEVRANDEVSLVGEQVRLNCDKPDDVPAWLEQELGARLDRPEPARSLPPQTVLGDAELLDLPKRPER